MASTSASFTLHLPPPPLTDRLPYALRVVLESAVRNCDGFQFLAKDASNILDWASSEETAVEIPFRPGRVILQDFT